MVIRPAEIIFLIGRWKQLHGGTAVLRVHLTGGMSKYASDIPRGEVSTEMSRGVFFTRTAAEHFSLWVVGKFLAVFAR